MKSFFLALWLFLLAWPVTAVELTAQARELNLLGHAQWLEDPTGQLSLNDVKAQGARFKPWQGGGTEMNFGFTDSAWWVRVPLQRQYNAPEEWLLEVHYAKLLTLDVYPPEGEPVRTGMSLPVSSKPYFDRNFVFPLRLSTEPQYLYLRATSRYALTVPLTLWAPDNFRQRQQRFQALQFMYYGGLVLLLMYGSVIYAALRDLRFLVYAAYIATAGVGIFASNGFGRLLLWSDLPSFDEIAQSLFLSLGAFFAVQFARLMLLAPGDRSWLALGLRASAGVFLLTTALNLMHWLTAWNLLRPSNQLLMLNSVLMGLLVSWASVKAWGERRSGVRFFALGWLLLWLGVTVAALRAFGLVPSNDLTSYAVQMATVFEMLLMAMALADILRLEQKAHRATQAQALAAKQALLERSQADEEKLKQAVFERTVQLENALRAEKDLREQYVRFGSMISHEFRTPLNVIQSQASLIRKERERGIDQTDRRLDAIRSASQRLTAMFDKWLHNDALNETLEVLDLRPMALQPWLRTLVQANPHLLLNHRVALRFDAITDQVMADEYHLGLALTNLMDNAAKYSPEHTTITLKTRSKLGHAGIAVCDEGPGIPHEVHDKVFAEFFRYAPESQIQGVGLGLSIVQRIAQAHGGHVELTSTPGHGACFCIWLPMRPLEDKP